MASANGQPGERTALYRIYDDAGVLLYIGITNSVPLRWNGHQAVQPWWGELRSLTVEWHETRAKAEAAEKAAILAEQPKYNVTYLRPTRLGRERRPPKAVPIEHGAVRLEPRADDEDLLSVSDVAEMTRMSSERQLHSAFTRTGGPKGFDLGGQTLFRRGVIRQWIADVEASQQKQGAA